MQDATHSEEEAGPRQAGAPEEELASLRTDNHSLRAALASLRARYHALLEELHLLKRRLYIAKAERLEDVASAQLAFDTLLVQANALAKVIEIGEQATDGASPPPGTNGSTGPAGPADKPKEPPKTPAKPKGRRKLADLDLPIVRLELVDEELEKTAERIGTDTSVKLGWQRGGYRKVVIERAVYKVDAAAAPSPSEESPEYRADDDAAYAATADVVRAREVEPGALAAAISSDAQPVVAPASTATSTGDAIVACTSEAVVDVEMVTDTAPAVETTHADEAGGSAEPDSARGARATPSGTGAFRYVRPPAPLELMKRGMLAPSMIAHLLATKYLMGVPFYRYEQQCAREGVPLDRGMMCRYAEHIGATLGCIVEAARKEAIATAFCLATDATGVSIQPEPLPDGKRQPCKKAHFFVTLADKDHVFLDYQPKHTSLTVWDMFKGFSGYIQADAHAIYDALFAGKPPEGADETEPLASPPTEVGCLAHARRKHWEAAACKHPLGLEGLRRVNAIFEADRPFAKLAPSERKGRRDESVRPLVEDYFAWVKEQYTKVTERGLVRTALGYSLRHEAALRRFLDDGRLRPDNNPSESALRGTIAVGRKAWLFYGSDDHAAAAGNLFSLIASCKLHRLDPEAYLADVIRLLPYWPRDRYLELAPRYWRDTRARIPPDEWMLPLGPITVPPPPAEKKPPPN